MNQRVYFPFGLWLGLCSIKPCLCLCQSVALSKMANGQAVLLAAYNCNYPPPPLQTPGVARDGLPGGGGDGRQVMVSGGGGGLQGYFKANCGTLH